MSEFAPVVRCAIYTRKSTEEGLEQQFNTMAEQLVERASEIANRTASVVERALGG